MNFGIGAPKEHDYSRAPTPKPWSINHQHVPNLEEGRSLHKHENFKELMQTWIGNSQSQTKCPNPLGPFPAFNPTNHIQLQSHIHEMSFVVWGPKVY